VKDRKSRLKRPLVGNREQGERCRYRAKSQSCEYRELSTLNVDRSSSRCPMPLQAAIFERCFYDQLITHVFWRINASPLLLWVMPGLSVHRYLVATYFHRVPRNCAGFLATIWYNQGRPGKFAAFHVIRLNCFASRHCCRRESSGTCFLRSSRNSPNFRPVLQIATHCVLPDIAAIGTLDERKCSRNVVRSH